MTEVTKTLELKLVEPNTHKRKKLRETRDVYQQALADLFDAGCTTPSEANDMVVNYDLSGYVKNALKQYVPQLCGGSYDAKELHDDHPVRFTNEGLCLDHKPENAIEWYVKIPHHEDYNLWMPAQPNPEQRDWLEALNAGDAEMGESRLFERDETWYLHVTATRDVEERSEGSDDERTSIGVDIGEASLVTVCHRDDHGSPTRPELWADEGKTVRRLRKTDTPFPFGVVWSFMCQYCSYRYHDGWTQLLQYDDVYQNTVSTESEATYGFHESWDELREEVGYGAS